MSKELDELRRLLDQLEQESKTVAFSRLSVLSDLAGERLRLFLAAWEGYPPARRRRLMQALVELAEASFEVNFDAIYRHSLDDPDDAVRALAIDGLWENEDQALIGPFLRLLRSDPSPRVRASAATALGRFVLAGELEKLEQTIAQRILTELLNRFHVAAESVEVRRRAIESAAYACIPEVTDALEMAYYDEDSRMQVSALFGMGRSCDRRWRPIVLKELESSSVAMRYEAARASGELGLRQAVPTLGGLLQDEDLQVREASIWALGQIGGPDAKRILTDAYEDADEEMAAALDEALAEHALQDGDLDLALYELDEPLEEIGTGDDEPDRLVWDGEEDEELDDDVALWDVEDEDTYDELEWDDEEDEGGDNDDEDELIDDDWRPGERESA